MPDSELVERAQTRVGSTLKGKYHIDRVLGVGGMAAVYGATHRNKKKFAIKMLHPELSLQGDAKQRFLREGYVANTVDHPGAVAVLDDDVADDGAAFIVMELLDGAAVDELADKHHGRLPPRAVLAIADQLLAVLEAAHSKEIVHRDLKPANLFLLRDGTLKVLDFGIARLREAVSSGPSGATQTGALMGTPAFLPPEQAGGRTREIDGQTDVWAVGATMFTLMSGEYIHTGENATQMVIFAATKPARSLASVVPVPAAIAALVDRAIAFDKSARWSDAASMRVALKEVYKAQFGALPSRDELVSLFEGKPAPVAAHTQRLPTPTPVHERVIQHDATMEAAGTGPRLSLGAGGTTAQPVSSTPLSDPAGVPARSSKSKLAVIGGAAVVAALALGFGIRTMTNKATATTDTQTGTNAAPTTASSSSPPVVTAVPSEVLPATTAATNVGAASIQTATPQPTHARIPSTTATTRPLASVTTSAAPTAKPTADCTPPYYYDAQNVRHFKPECVK